MKFVFHQCERHFRNMLAKVSRVFSHALEKYASNLILMLEREREKGSLCFSNDARNDAVKYSKYGPQHSYLSKSTMFFRILLTGMNTHKYTHGWKNSVVMFYQRTWIIYIFRRILYTLIK